MNNALEVSIFGVTLTIKSKEDKEYLEKLASFVDESMNDIANSYGNNKSREVIAILTCLNIADMLKKEELENKTNKDILKTLKESISSRTIELINIIENK